MPRYDPVGLAPSVRSTDRLIVTGPARFRDLAGRGLLAVAAFLEKGDIAALAPGPWACHDCPWQGASAGVVRWVDEGPGPDRKPRLRSCCPNCAGWAYPVER